MTNRIQFTLITLFHLLLSQNLFSQILVQGTVTDNGAEYLGSGAEPVAGALVTLTNLADTSCSFSSYTNEKGEYSIYVTQTGVDGNDSNTPIEFRLLQNYPNPFYSSTIISYTLSRPSYLCIELYNVLGQKVKTLSEGFHSNSGHLIWDATNERGQRVSAGVYIYSMKTETSRQNKKLLLLDGPHQETHMASSKPGIMQKAIGLLSDNYTLEITGANIAPYKQQNIVITSSMTIDATVARIVKDYDGDIYKTVKIGDQWWMMENLKVTRFRNGDAIPNITDNTVWTNMLTGAYCNYDNDEANVATYGRLYNWYAVNDGRNIAPEGWRIPSLDEGWETLFHFLAGDSVAGGKIKEAGTVHWRSANIGATNESGFCSLPGGYRGFNHGYFSFMGVASYFWSSTEDTTFSAWRRYLEYDSRCFYQDSWNKNHEFSVGCVRD